MVHASGVIVGQAREHDAARDARRQDALDGGQLFWRAVLCNFLVCLGIWMFTRAQGDGAKTLVLWLPVFVFVAAGFEHCVANMALFSLGIFDGSATFGELFHNLAFTISGNIVGGGLLVGAVYWFTTGAKRSDFRRVMPWRRASRLLRPQSGRDRPEARAGGFRTTADLRGAAAAVETYAH